MSFQPTAEAKNPVTIFPILFQVHTPPGAPPGTPGPAPRGHSRAWPLQRAGGNTDPSPLLPRSSLTRWAPNPEREGASHSPPIRLGVFLILFNMGPSPACPWASPSLGAPRPCSLGGCDLRRREVGRESGTPSVTICGPPGGVKGSGGKTAQSWECCPVWVPGCLLGGSEAAECCPASARNLLPPPAPESMSGDKRPRAPLPSAEASLTILPAVSPQAASGRKGLWIQDHDGWHFLSTSPRARVLNPPPE